MKPRHECPGCGGCGLSAPFTLTRQPVVLNYRFANVDEARRLARRDVQLRQCSACGLVFNAAFDASVVPYDSRYENRQGCSPAFRAHVASLVKRLARIPKARGGRLLEVGCGKGEFLREAAAALGATAEGYDTSYEGPSTDGAVQFHTSYLRPSEVRGERDVVICRHVVEHVPEIGAFLKLLAGIARAAGDPVVVLETPRFEWIVENRCLWDIFYEHCNYFPEASLAHLCRRAGFRVVRQVPVFGDQYQWLELRVAQRPAVPEAPGVKAEVRLGTFARKARGEIARIGADIRRYKGGKPWAVWGAGAKGVALVHLLPRLRPVAVVDSNPAKQGGIIPGSSVPIIAPDDSRIRRLGLVVVANPNYLDEICGQLDAADFGGTVLPL